MKKIIALLIALVMLFSIGTAAYAESPKGLVYTALGDSSSNGYGMDEYGDRTYIYGQVVDATYPAKFAKAVGAETFNQDCLSGLRSEDLRYLLDPENYAGDAYTFEVAFGGYVMGSIARDGIASVKQLSDLYIQHVKEADIVSLNIGLNNFGNFLITNLNTLLGGGEVLEYSLDSEMEELLSNELVEAFKEAVFDVLGNIEITEGMDAGLLAKAADALTGWMVYTYIDNLRCLDAIIERIYELNPDVELYVLGMTDPMGHVCLTGDMINIGALTTLEMDSINTHLKYFAPYCWKYSYVDIMDTESFGIGTNLTDEGFIDSMTADNGKNLHPSYAGHEYIFNQLWNAYQLPFKDISSSDDSYEAVRYAYRNGLLDAAAGLYFLPLNGITRAEAANALYVLAGSPDVSSMSEPFCDVSADSEYYSAIVWAYNNGIMPGISSKVFSPIGLMNRSTLASVLYAFAGSPEVSEIAFKDKGLIKSANRNAASWCVEEGIMSADKNYFNPGLMVTREYFAQVLYAMR